MLISDVYAPSEKSFSSSFSRVSFIASAISDLRGCSDIVSAKKSASYSSISGSTWRPRWV